MRTKGGFVHLLLGKSSFYAPKTSVNSWCAIPNTKHKLGQISQWFSVLSDFYDDLSFIGLAKKAKVTSR
jgi:hypothetical protein